jgi:hypothetical protein
VSGQRANVSIGSITEHPISNFIYHHF